MGLEELEEALLRQRQDFAETEIVPLIAKVLEIEEPTVLRVVAAFMCLMDSPYFRKPFHQDPATRAILALDEEVFLGIEEAINVALQRARMARHIQEGEPLNVYAWALLAEANVNEVCNGCPQRLRCIAENLSTPKHCHTYRHMQVRVLSLKGRTIHVAADHPKGEYDIDIYGLPYLHFPFNPFPEK